MSELTQDIARVLGLRVDGAAPNGPVVRISRLAWAALALGVASPISFGAIPFTDGFFGLPFVVALIAIPASILALVRIALARGRRRGDGLALGGLLLGIGTAVFYILAVARPMQNAIWM
jgi:hypothetical protein